MLNERGLLVILSGPSGAGKDTVLKKLLEKDINIKLSVSATTRAPREQEKNGEDYYFLSKAEFVQLISKNEILEHAEYCGNYYGTPTAQVNEWLNKGKDVILEIEVNGAQQIRKKRPDAISIFILPPSMRALEERLKCRGTETSEFVCKRLEIARKEVKSASEYDYIVINETVEQCAEDIRKVIACEKMRSYRKSNLIKEVLENA